MLKIYRSSLKTRCTIRDLYSLIGLRREDRPSQKEIKAAYRRVAAKLHPDKGTQNHGAFDEAAGAYRILSDEKSKIEYDKLFEPYSSVQDLFLRHVAQSRRMLEVRLPMPRAAKRRGGDVLIIKKVTSKVLLEGGTIKVEITWHAMPTTDEVAIKGGESKIRFCRHKFLGNPGVNNGQNGDLILVVIPE